jgi:phospholipase/carboxylesterase
MTTLLDLRSDDLGLPDAATPPAVALLLHGYGSNERDLAGLVPMLGLQLPWASLRAPLPAGPGTAWFEITTPGSPDAEPVEAATAAIWAWVDEHLDATTRVVPIGFSQGGLMATQLLRTRPERVLAPVVLGGFVLGAPQPADAELAASRPAVFWGRGADDRVITPHAIVRTSEWLPAHSTLTERVYPGLAHGIDARELADVREFLTRSLVE